MVEKFPEEGEVVLCTVVNLMGTTVFVNIEKYSKPGTITTSEVAPGRIRNIRDYVMINKKIVCKVLRVSQEKGQIDLSLRRVSQKDSKEILEEYKKEKSAFLILTLVLKEKAGEVAEKIKKKQNLSEFMEKLRENPALIEEFVSKDEAKQISKLVSERIKEKKFESKAVISISFNTPNGIVSIKNALTAVKNVKVAYLGAPFYSVSSISNNPKEAEKTLNAAVEAITEKVKSAGGKIEVKDV